MSIEIRVLKDKELCDNYSHEWSGRKMQYYTKAYLSIRDTESGIEKIIPSYVSTCSKIKSYG